MSSQEEKTLIREISILREENDRLKKVTSRSQLCKEAVGFVVFCSRGPKEDFANAAKNWLDKYNADLKALREQN